MTATTAPPRRIERATTISLVARGASAPALPDSVVGQVEGIALVYDVVDSYNTTFARGCLDRAAVERVAKGKVKLYWDHGDSMLNGTYDTHLHIGTVRELKDQQLPDGTWGAVFRADLFDTEPGREAHEYLKAIAATGSETGVSIGMLFMPETTRAVIDGTECERIRAVPLREISITGESAVPGTRVTAVRAEQMATLTLDIGPASSTTGADAIAPLSLPSPTLNYEPLLRGIQAAIGVDAFRLLTTGILGDAQPKASDAPSGVPADGTSDARTGDSQPAAVEAARTDLAPIEDRLAFVRANYQRLYFP